MLPKEGHLLVALCFYILTCFRLLAARAVTATVAGRIAGLARVVAAITLVGHVFDPFYFWVGKSQWARSSVGRWAPIWPMTIGSPGLRGWTT
jgi:hypothetical protein